MQYSKFEQIKNFSLQHRNIVVLFLCLIITLCVVIPLSFSLKSQTQVEEFSEIQKFLLETQEKDKDIYNRKKYVEVKKISKGIDVSSFQGDIDWEKVKESGIDFVMIRCGFRNLTISDLGVDNKFHYNISEANRLGIPVGIYFYSTAINEIEAIEEATFVLNLIKDYDITYPVVYDFELFNQKRTKGVTADVINKNADLFLNYMETHGYKGMLYFNLTALDYYWNLDYFSNKKLWLAHYANGIDYEGQFDMWQYADNGRIDGIKGNVDLNISYFSYEEVND